MTTPKIEFNHDNEIVKGLTYGTVSLNYTVTPQLREEIRNKLKEIESIIVENFTTNK